VLDYLYCKLIIFKGKNNKRGLMRQIRRKAGLKYIKGIKFSKAGGK